MILTDNDTDRQWYRQTEMQTDRDTDRQIYRQTEIQTYRDMDRHRYKHTKIQAGIDTYKHRYRQTEILADTLTGTHRGSAISNGREPRSCLGQVFNIKLGSFVSKKLNCMSHTQPLLELKTRPRFRPSS